MAGEPQPLEDHDELRWLAPDRIDDVDWLEQDRPAVARAAQLLAAEAPEGAADPEGAVDAEDPAPPRAH